MKDFGAGYSSLSYLRRLPVSELKLDPSFVADLQHDEAARSLSSAILGVGKSLHLSVVAEGVETDAQRNCSRTWAIRQPRGFCLQSPPSIGASWLACLQPAEPRTGCWPCAHPWGLRIHRPLTNSGRARQAVPGLRADPKG
jgi:EAL domain-containing protein (putative c-di-GMP-specific phosphodiesterase class I)